MKENTLSKHMREIEGRYDWCVPRDRHIVVRLDGRGFTKMTRDAKFDKPYDISFCDMMAHLTAHLMERSGFKMLYGYTQSDEVSLLFHPEDNTFGRKHRKIISVLAGIASSYFTGEIIDYANLNPVAFDARVLELESEDIVRYFIWRRADALRNCIQSHAYWMLRKDGMNGRQAHREIHGISSRDMKELLRKSGLSFEDIPRWHKFGVGCYHKEIEVEGYNPIKRETVTTMRNTCAIDKLLPEGDDYYSSFIESLLTK